jgi:hypothetical protein
MSNAKAKVLNSVEGESRLCYSPDEIPRATGGAISRTRVYAAMKSGRLRAKRDGRRTIITADELRRYIAALPDREQRKNGLRNDNRHT